MTVVVVLALALPWAALTALGDRRRGGGPARNVVAAAVFPLTWVTWYALDELCAPGTSDAV